MLRLKVSDNAAFTLIEVMIAMAVSTMIAAVMYIAFQTQVKSQVAQDVSLKMTQSLRAAMEIMTTDIRLAGCDPTEGADAAIQTATAVELRMTMDLRGEADGRPDGDCSDPNEDVRYFINAASGHLERDAGDGNGPQPLVRHCDAINFVYLDRLGNTMDPAAGAFDPDDIASIQVSILTRSADIDNPALLANYTDSRSYINLQGVEIFRAPGDQFRRFQLSATIDRRNL